MDMHGKTREDLEQMRERLAHEVTVGAGDLDDIIAEIQQIDFTLGEIDAGRNVPLR